MISRLENRLLSTRKGNGLILDKDRSLVKVFYYLKIFEEVRVYQIKDFSEEVGGSISIQGNITILDKHVSLDGKVNLRLQLEDGRKISIGVIRITDILNNKYEIEISDAFAWT